MYSALHLDNWLRKHSTAELCVVTFVIGVVLLFSAQFPKVAEYTVQLEGMKVPKQVGIWYGGINWVVIFVLVYPALILWSARMAHTARDVAARLLEHVDDALDGFLSKSRFAIPVIAIGSLIVSIGLWYRGGAEDIIYCETNNDIIFWVNGIVKTKHCPNLPVVVYSLFVYLWLGFVAFSYVTSLFLCIMYSSFIRDTFSRRQNDSRKEARNLSVLKPLTFEISMICTLGLVAIFFMNLQQAYLTSTAADTREFLTTYLNLYERIKLWVSPLNTVTSPSYHHLNEIDVNLNSVPSFMVFAITIVTFSASIYNFWVGARLYVAPGGRTPSVALILMGARPYLIAAVALSLSSFFIDVGLAIISMIVVRVVIFLFSIFRK